MASKLFQTSYKIRKKKERERTDFFYSPDIVSVKKTRMEGFDDKQDATEIWRV